MLPCFRLLFETPHDLNPNTNLPRAPWRKLHLYIWDDKNSNPYHVRAPKTTKRTKAQHLMRHSCNVPPTLRNKHTRAGFLRASFKTQKTKRNKKGHSLDMVKTCKTKFYKMNAFSSSSLPQQLDLCAQRAFLSMRNRLGALPLLRPTEMCNGSSPFNGTFVAAKDVYLETKGSLEKKLLEQTIVLKSYIFPSCFDEPCCPRRSTSPTSLNSVRDV